MIQDPKHIHIADYDYPLPDERIAKYPKTVRDESKLLRTRFIICPTICNRANSWCLTTRR